MMACLLMMYAMYNISDVMLYKGDTLGMDMGDGIATEGYTHEVKVRELLCCM